MKRIPSLLTACLLLSSALGCKTLQSDVSSTSQTDSSPTPTAVQDAIKKLAVCFGQRELFAKDHLGFDFTGPQATLATAYWSAIASSVVYEASSTNRALMEHLAGHSLSAFHFYGEPVNSAGTEGYIADFDQGMLIAMRGTADFRDLLTDLTMTHFRGKAFNREGKLEPLKVHKGFWFASGVIWDDVLKNVLASAPETVLAPGSEESFRQGNQILRSIIQEADIEGYNPNEHFKPEILRLQKIGVIKPNADINLVLSVLNIWAEEAMLASRAYVQAVKAGNMAGYDAVVERGLARKKRNFGRIHGAFVYREYKPIWLTGHSLGGAISTVLAYRLLKTGIPVKGLITFGSPRVGNDVFEYFLRGAMQEDGVDGNILRFQNNNDGVSRVPHFAGFRHVGDPWYITADRKLMVREPPERLRDTLRASLARYKDTVPLTWYTGELPPGYRGLWTFDLKRAASDHSMFAHYLPHIESFAFGEKAKGCP